LESVGPTNPVKSNTFRNEILRRRVRRICLVSRVVTLKLKVASANLQCRHCPLRLADFAVFSHCTELSTRPTTFREHKHILFQVVISVTFYVECQFLHRQTGILVSDVSFISSKGQRKGFGCELCGHVSSACRCI